MKRKTNPIVPVKAIYLGEVSTAAELVAALKAAAEPFEPPPLLRWLSQATRRRWVRRRIEQIVEEVYGPA